MAWRPSAFIHELLIPPCLAQRAVTTELMNSAMRLDINRRHLMRQAVFMIDGSNSAMLRYVREVGAVEQSGLVFLLDLTKIQRQET